MSKSEVFFSHYDGNGSSVRRDDKSYEHPENFYIGERDLSKSNWKEPLNENGLYPIEIKYAGALLETCGYLSTEEKQLVGKSIYYAMRDHRDQYRGTGEPFSVHSITVAGICALLKMDGKSIAAAVSHDRKEDCHTTYEQIKQELGEEVAGMVESLSKITRRSKSVEDEAYHKQWIVDGLEDPRILFIKLAGDRLHNLRTLSGLSPGKRVAIVQETVETMLPIARVLGLDKVYLPSHPLFNPPQSPDNPVPNDLSIVGQMEYLCLLYSDKKELAEEILSCLDSQYKSYQPDQIDIDTQESLSIANIKPPSLYEVFLRKKGTAGSTEGSCYPVAEVSVNVNQNYAPEEWGMAIEHYLSYLRYRSQYEIVEGPTSNDVYRDIMEWDRQVIPVTVKDKTTGKLLELRLMPLFLKRVTEVSPLSYIQNFSNKNLLDKEEGAEAFWGRERINYVKNRFDKFKLAKPGLKVHQIVGVLEKGLPGYIWVTGEDDNNNKESWPVKKGSTIMDYARNIEPTYYSSAIKFIVKRENTENEVPPDYVLQKGDVIHIEGIDKSKDEEIFIDPKRIFSFVTDTEGPLELGKAMWRRVRGMDRQGSEGEEYNRIMEEAENIGREQVRRLLSRPMVVDISSIEDVLLRINKKGESHFFSSTYPRQKEKQDYYRKKFFEKFYQLVGFNRFSGEVLNQVKEALEKSNNSVRVFMIKFGKGQTGQDARVKSIFYESGVNILGSYSSQDYRGSGIVVFADHIPALTQVDILDQLYNLHHDMNLSPGENSVRIQSYGDIDPAFFPSHVNLLSAF